MLFSYFQFFSSARRAGRPAVPDILPPAHHSLCGPHAVLPAYSTVWACASKSDAKPEFTSPLKSSQLFKDIGYIPIIVSFFPIFSLINSPTFSFGICRENASSPNRFSSAICRYRSSLLVTFLPLDSLSIFRL